MVLGHLQCPWTSLFLLYEFDTLSALELLCFSEQTIKPRFLVFVNVNTSFFVRKSNPFLFVFCVFFLCFYSCFSSISTIILLSINKKNTITKTNVNVNVNIQKNKLK